MGWVFVSQSYRHEAKVVDWIEHSCWTARLNWNRRRPIHYHLEGIALKEDSIRVHPVNLLLVATDDRAEGDALTRAESPVRTGTVRKNQAPDFFHS